MCECVADITVDRRASPPGPFVTQVSVSTFSNAERDHYDDISSLYDAINEQADSGYSVLDQASRDALQQSQTHSLCDGLAAAENADEINLTDHMEMNELAADDNDVSGSFIITIFIMNLFSRLLRLLLLVTK